MKNSLRAVFGLLSLSLAWVPVFAQAQTPYSERMQQWLNQRQYEEAYRYAQNHADVNDASYGLWMGVAAQGMGKLHEAEALLQNFIDTHPEHPQAPRARLELGLTLYLLGDMSRANAELTRVAQVNPPETVLNKIQQLKSLAEQSSPWQFSGQLEAGGGHDSNANAGITSANVVLPTLGSVTINESGLKTSAAFSTLVGAGTVNYRWDRNWSALAIGSLETKLYKSYSNLNQTTPLIGLGGMWQQDNMKWRLLQIFQQLQLGGEKYRDYSSTNLELTYDMDTRNRWTFVGSTGRMDYNQANQTRNSDVMTYAVDYTHAFKMDGNPVLTLGLSDSKETSTTGHSEFGRRIKGNKLAISFEPGPSWYSGAQALVQNIRHEELDPLYLVTRADSYKSLGIFVGHKYSAQVSFQLDWQHLHNNSNIDIWTNDRNILSFKIRSSF